MLTERWEGVVAQTISGGGVPGGTGASGRVGANGGNVPEAAIFAREEVLGERNRVNTVDDNTGHKFVKLRCALLMGLASLAAVSLSSIHMMSG